MFRDKKEYRSAFRFAVVAFLIVMPGLYVILRLSFGSGIQPFVVLISVPVGIIGMIIALVIHNACFSFMNCFGLIGLISLTVHNSVGLVSRFNLLRRLNPDQDIIDLAISGTADRMWSVILTSLATFVILLPFAHNMGGYNEFFVPVALTIGWGIFATPLILVMTPCLYIILHNLFKGRMK